MQLILDIGHAKTMPLHLDHEAHDHLHEATLLLLKHQDHLVHKVHADAALAPMHTCWYVVLSGKLVVLYPGR